jgi:hypothetical protein
MSDTLFPPSTDSAQVHDRRPLQEDEHRISTCSYENNGTSRRRASSSSSARLACSDFVRLHVADDIAELLRLNRQARNDYVAVVLEDEKTVLPRPRLADAVRLRWKTQAKPSIPRWVPRRPSTVAVPRRWSDPTREVSKGFVKSATLLRAVCYDFCP